MGAFFRLQLVYQRSTTFLHSTFIKNLYELEVKTVKMFNQPLIGADVDLGKTVGLWSLLI